MSLLTVHHSLLGMKKEGSHIDPTIIACYYGSTEDFGYPVDTNRKNCTYDTSKPSPFDLTQTTWRGTPQLITEGNTPRWSNIPDLVKLCFDNNWTTDCFYRHVSSGGRVSEILGPTFASSYYVHGGAGTKSYGNPLLYVADTTHINITDDTNINDGNWHHLAMTGEFISRKTEDYTNWKFNVFLDGVLKKTDTREIWKVERYTYLNVYNPDSWYIDSGCKSAFSQVTLRIGIKWASNFTPPTKPYYLGE